jgi:hypothetical protein
LTSLVALWGYLCVVGVHIVALALAEVVAGVLADHIMGQCVRQLLKREFVMVQVGDMYA